LHHPEEELHHRGRLGGTQREAPLGAEQRQPSRQKRPAAGRLPREGEDRPRRRLASPARASAPASRLAALLVADHRAILVEQELRVLADVGNAALLLLHERRVQRRRHHAARFTVWSS
jgi:hypothetical protein